MITVPPIYCAYCSTPTLDPVEHGRQPMFVGGTCRICKLDTYVTIDDAELAVSRPQPSTPTRVQRVSASSEAGKRYSGVLRQVAMHPTSGQFFALIECDDGTWQQAHVATLRTETPS